MMKCFYCGCRTEQLVDGTSICDKCYVKQLVYKAIITVIVIGLIIYWITK